MSGVLSERRGDVVVVTIDRAGRRNAIDGEAARDLAAAFRDVEADDGVAVAVLTGAGGTFCGR